MGTFAAPPLFFLLTKENPMSIEGRTGHLIASDRVEGTAAYGPGDHQPK
jgi:hypothetical protein